MPEIMDRIKEANRAVTTGIDDSTVKHWVTIYIMGLSLIHISEPTRRS